MKGSYYTIEAALAILLVVSIFFILFITPQENPEIERSNIKTDIHGGLETLDLKGSLRDQAIKNNATAIKNDLDDFLPLGIQIHVAIYNESLSNLTAEASDQSGDIVAVSYYIAGDVGNYTPKEIRVHAWEFE